MAIVHFFLVFMSVFIVLSYGFTLGKNKQPTTIMTIMGLQEMPLAMIMLSCFIDGSIVTYTLLSFIR